MNRFEWTEARSAAEAAGLASTTAAQAMTAPEDKPLPDDGAILKAGGIDLLDLMKEDLLRPRRLVNLRAIPGLDAITSEDAATATHGLRIGALATLEQIAAHAEVRKRYTALAEAAQASASPQIRHVATLGGNLLQRPHCWYFRAAFYHCLRKGGNRCYALFGENQYHAIFDNHACAIVHPSTAATALVALDARLELMDKAGARREIGLERFFVSPDTDIRRENDLKPGEIVTAVLLPASPPSLRSVHLKQGERDAFDWPLADVAIALDLAPDRRCRRAGIVLGAAAPVPYRARAAEVALAGKTLDEALVARAAREALDGATPLAENGYKVPLLEALVRRALTKAAELT